MLTYDLVKLTTFAVSLLKADVTGRRILLNIELLLVIASFHALYEFQNCVFLIVVGSFFCVCVLLE